MITSLLFFAFFTGKCSLYLSAPMSPHLHLHHMSTIHMCHVSGLQPADSHISSALPISSTMFARSDIYG